MKVTDEDLLELASSINDLVCIENFEVFAKRHKKLVELYQRLLKDGLKTEYEYLCHENNEIIPCIVFDPIKNDKVNKPGLPGIVVASKCSNLYLIATDTTYAFNGAIEYDNQEDDLFNFLDYYEDGYSHEIFKTNSVSDMISYLKSLSELEKNNGGILIPITKERVVAYWTRMLDNGTISYDRVSIYQIRKESFKVLDDTNGSRLKSKYLCRENYSFDKEEEKLIVYRINEVKNIISEISKNYMSNNT